MLNKVFCVVVLSGALVAMAKPAERPAVAAPASVVFSVNSTLDVKDDNVGDGICRTDPLGPAAGACTLRAAVMEADVASSAGGATILVPAGIYTLLIPPDGADGANTGDLNLTSGNPIVISIVGAGAASTIIDANQSDRVLRVDANRTAAISGVTLRGGYSPGDANGAGLLNNGFLTLDHSIVAGNQSLTFSGGGIANFNVLTVTHSTIGPNNSAPTGGGIYSGNGQVTLDRSTVYGNSANLGAGIFNYSTSSLFIINTTLSSNIAAKNAGGLDNRGAANVYNSTIVFNGADTQLDSSSAAGGVFSDNAGVFNIRNTLLAGNYNSNSRTDADCVGIVHSYGRNLFGTLTPCTVDPPAGGNWGAVNSFDLIGPLQNNGGPTWTHALLAGSNAIDGGDPFAGCVDENSIPLATDQRGVPRVVGASCDIGAYEYLPPVAFLPILRN